MHICHIFPQFRSLAGGERLVIKICNLLLHKGFKVTLLTLGIKEECERELEKGVSLLVIAPFLDKIKNHYQKVFLEHLFVYRLANFIPKDTDFLYFHKSSSLPALFYFKRFLKGKIPTFYFCYEPPRFLYDLKEETLARLGIWKYFIRPFYPLFRFLDKKFIGDSGTILTFSRFMEGEIERIYAKRAKMIGPLGVDFPERERKERNGDKILLTVNRLQPRKRVDILITALPLVLKEYPKIKVFIVGTGPEEEKLKRLVVSLGLEKVVEFCGYVKEENLPDFYSQADIYIHLAKNEPFGLSVLEALSFGLPVVSVKEGGVAELVEEGETGLFCEPEKEDLAKKILFLLREEDKREEMGKKAGLFVREKFRWEDFIERFIRILKEKKDVV